MVQKREFLDLLELTIRSRRSSPYIPVHRLQMKRLTPDSETSICTA